MADEIVAPGEMDAAIEARAAALASAGAVSGAANRARSGSARSRSTCSASTWPCTPASRPLLLLPALIRNLEENWRAHERVA